MKKSREFWIQDRVVEGQQGNFTYASFSPKTHNYGDPEIHVIEKAAYDSLMKDVSGLIEALDLWNETGDILRIETAALKALAEWKSKYGDGK